MSHRTPVSLTKPALVACAAALSAVSASAQTLAFDPSASNSGTFLFSDNLIAAYGVINATVGALAPATEVIGSDTDGSITGTVGATFVAGASAPLTGVTLDASNDIVNINSQGGNFQSAPTSAVSDGGLLTINNLSYDSATNIIYADVGGANLANTYVLPTTHEAVFTVGSLAYSTDGGVTYTPIADPTAFALPGAGTYTIRASNLFTVGGNSGAVAQQFISLLGLKSIGLSTFKGIDTPNSPVWGNDGFGTLTTTITVKAVPEPSTMALLGFGVLGLAVAGRRSTRQ